MIQGLLLDCDGVLADSEALNYRCWAEAFRARLGVVLPGDASALVGLDLERIYRFGIEAAGLSYDEVGADERAALLAHKAELFLALAPRELRPVRGAPELVAAATSRRLPRVVVSSALRGRLLRTLEFVGLAGGWSGVFAGEDLISGRPPTKDWRRAAASIGIPLASCAVLEDSAENVASARAAGVGCVVGVSSTFGEHRMLEAGAHVVVPGPWAIELDHLVERAAGGPCSSR